LHVGRVRRRYTEGMFGVTGLRRRACACAVLVAVALAGCGQEDGGGSAGDPPETASSSAPGEAESVPPGTPDCGEIWQAGAKLPRGYQGCADETGAYVERDALGCSSGQRMVRYGDRFWGVLGGTVNEADGSLARDRDYKASVRSCSA